MSPPFMVLTAPRFESLARNLSKRHPDFSGALSEAISILATDPLNVNREHQIRKLVGVLRGDGQYRLRLRRWRFRYDLYGREVLLTYCGLRRESTYS